LAENLSLFLLIAAAPGIFFYVEATTAGAPQPHLSPAAVAELAATFSSQQRQYWFQQHSNSHHREDLPPASSSAPAVNGSKLQAPTGKPLSPPCSSGQLASISCSVVRSSSPPESASSLLPRTAAPIQQRQVSLFPTLQIQFL